MSFHSGSLMLFGALVAVTACHDPETPPQPSPLGDVVVLNGVDPAGVSILDDAGGTPSHRPALG